MSSRCRRCKYDLSAHVAKASTPEAKPDDDIVCPECGYAMDLIDLVAEPTAMAGSWLILAIGLMGGGVAAVWLASRNVLWWWTPPVVWVTWSLAVTCYVAKRVTGHDRDQRSLDVWVIGCGMILIGGLAVFFYSQLCRPW